MPNLPGPTSRVTCTRRSLRGLPTYTTLTLRSPQFQQRLAKFNKTSSTSPIPHKLNHRGSAPEKMQIIRGGREKNKGEESGLPFHSRSIFIFHSPSSIQLRMEAKTPLKSPYVSARGEISTMEDSPPTPFSAASSSFSASVSLSNFSSLPVMSLKEKIVEKILDNRVTLIVGETGCGKSSQIPQFLLENNVKPILCTQPRRFAVVAVAKMVAKARKCEMGDEVGYHIGHSKVMSARSMIVFKTAGVLLDEMREKGLNALNYKVIILDEVHERSLESDLVLVCVKQFLLRNNDLRVVLMSATADIARYRDYFKDLGRGERVEVLAIPSTNQQAVYQQRVSYIEQVTRVLGVGVSPDLLASAYCSGPNPSSATAAIKPEVHKLINDLITHIHENEPDIEKGILVFLPTYYDLEQQWYLLKRFGSPFKVYVLHSSIDTEQALMAMRIWKSHRKVILATNIAESSVTIPKLAYVIDSCRSLQVFWDPNRKKEASELVWVSKSQADQRKGRTGRTCDGQTYRLVTGSFFNKFNDYERPSILRLSLRLQVLQICCAEARVINDPKVLLQKALDPPELDVIEDALGLLVHIKALNKVSTRGRQYEPTFYGLLLASFSLSYDASILVLKFGDAGLLREGILLGILMDTQPLPITRPFGDNQLFTKYIHSYLGGDWNNHVKLGRREIELLGNLCAYQFWQRVFKDKHRLEHLKQLLKYNEIKAATLLLPKIEEEWCSFHNLVQTSLHHVSERYEDVLNSLHRFRPQFFGASGGLPTYLDPYEFHHTCLLKCQTNGDTEIVVTVDELNPCGETMKCVAVPFVASHDFQIMDVAEKLLNIIKEIRVQYTDSMAGNQHDYVMNGSHVNGVDTMCVFFIKGFCSRGTQCPFSHSLEAKTPPCKFFFSLQGCRNGKLCPFSHDQDPSVLSHRSNSCEPEDGEIKAVSQLFSTSSNGSILLLDDTDLHFSSNFARHYNPSQIICTTSLSDKSIYNESLEGVRILWGLHHPYQTIIGRARQNPIPWTEVKSILWFPNLDIYNENMEIQKTLVQNFFEFLAIRIMGDALYEAEVIVTMNNIKFAQLQVEKLGRDSFFYLRQSIPFDEARYGVMSDVVTTRKPMVASMPISYIFYLHPPTDIQFDNCAATLDQCLHHMGKISVMD